MVTVATNVGNQMRKYSMVLMLHLTPNLKMEPEASLKTNRTRNRIKNPGISVIGASSRLKLEINLYSI